MEELKVLLCIRGNDYGEYAAGFVGRLAKGIEIDCTLLHVEPKTKTFYGFEFPTPRTKEEIDGFIGRVLKILKTYGVSKFQTILREGEPVREILQESERGGYSMVVTGTHGAKGLDRFLFESVSYHVAEYAAVPVLVVRDEAIRHKRVMVATDGSEASREAVYYCGHLARGLGFNVTVLSVAPAKEAMGGSEVAVEDAKETLKTEFGIEAEGKIVVGSPVEKILEESGNKDLVIMGSRGLSKIKRLLLGHVSQRVLADEKANVLIVRNCEVYNRRAT